ncbi:MAG: hypothetical protein V4500_08525 [Pseudomonadota bacterium]
MNSLRTLMLLGVAVGFAACSKKEDYALPKTGIEKAEIKSFAATNVNTLEREQFLSRAQQEVAELGTRIETLRKQAQRATAEFQPKILALDAEMKNLQTKLTELKTTTTTQWKTLKIDIESSMDRLRNAVDKAGKK